MTNFRNLINSMVNALFYLVIASLMNRYLQQNGQDPIQLLAMIAVPLLPLHAFLAWRESKRQFEAPMRRIQRIRNLIARHQPSRHQPQE